MKKTAVYLYLLEIRRYMHLFPLRAIIMGAILFSLLIVLLIGEAHMALHMQPLHQDLSRLSPLLSDHDPWD